MTDAFLVWYGPVCVQASAYVFVFRRIGHCVLVLLQALCLRIYCDS